MKKLSTENRLAKGVMAKLLRPIFLDDDSLEMKRNQLYITRRLIHFEQKFYSSPGSLGVLEKISLPALLYEFILYRFDETAHEYVTRDIQDKTRLSDEGHLIVVESKEAIKKRIFDQYGKINKEKIIRESLKIESMAQGIDLSEVYNARYFETEAYKQEAGALMSDLKEENSEDADRDFLERINNLFILRNHLTEIINKALKPQLSSGLDEKSGPLEVSFKEYSEFDITDFIGPVDRVINQVLHEQVQYLNNYLNNLINSPEAGELVRELKKICKYIPMSRPEEQDSLQLLLEWEMLRIRIAASFSKINWEKYSIEWREKLHRFCYVDLRPQFGREVVPPDMKLLDSPEYKIISDQLTYFTKQILRKKLPKACGQIYFRNRLSSSLQDRLSRQKEILEEHIATHEKQLLRTFEKESIHLLNETVLTYQIGLVHLVIRPMLLGLSKEMNNIIFEKFSIIFSLDRCDRLLLKIKEAKEENRVLKIFLENQKKRLLAESKENLKKEEWYRNRENGLSSRPASLASSSLVSAPLSISAPASVRDPGIGR